MKSSNEHFINPDELRIQHRFQINGMKNRRGWEEHFKINTEFEKSIQESEDLNQFGNRFTITNFRLIREDESHDLIEKGVDKRYSD